MMNVCSQTARFFIKMETVAVASASASIYMKKKTIVKIAQ